MIRLLLPVALLMPFLDIGSAQAAERFQDCPDCPEMVVIPAGNFNMGSPEAEPDREAHEGPVHRVDISDSFALGVSEVTVGEYARFVDDSGYPGGTDCITDNGMSWDLRPGQGWQSPGFPQTPESPATCLNTQDVEAYLRWLSRKNGQRYRLPTEAEWEYAARAGTTTRLPHGDDPDYADTCQWGNAAALESGFQYRNRTSRDEHAYTAPVRAYPANPFGLHGMLGNVLEWTEDCYSPDYTRTPTDGSAMTEGACHYRVLRGGTWAGAAQHMRPANRALNDPAARWSTTGFRIARDID